MPAYQQMFGRVNQHFNSDNIAGTKDLIQQALLDGVPLVEIADQLGVPANPGQRMALDNLPRGIEAALRGLLSDNFSRNGAPWEVQFVWEPSYDYRLTVHEANATDISNGGISVIVGTPYPGDERTPPQ